MKKIFNKALIVMCIAGVLLLVGCGNTESNNGGGNVVGNNGGGTEQGSTNNSSEKTQSVKTYVKGDTFEIEGCKFTIDDIILDVHEQNVCAVLLTVVNNSDNKFSFANANFYADNFECESAYLSNVDERLEGYVSAGLKSVEAGRAIKVYYDTTYPEDCTELEAEVMKSYGGSVLYKIRLK